MGRGELGRMNSALPLTRTLLGRDPKTWRNDYYEVRLVKDMRTVNGKREWLCAWVDLDENDVPFPDTWEPTRFVMSELRVAYLENRKLNQSTPVVSITLDSHAIIKQAGVTEKSNLNAAGPYPIRVKSGIS